MGSITQAFISVFVVGVAFGILLGVGIVGLVVRFLA